MKFLLATILTLSVIWLTGCGGVPPRLHYSTTVIQHQTVSKSDRRPLVAHAKEIAGDRLIRYRRGAGRYKTIKANRVSTLPLAALNAIYMLSDEKYHGAEMDLLIRQSGHGRVPVSIQIDLKGDIKIDLGGKRRAKAKELSAAPKFRAGKVAWTPKSQGIVTHAVSLLNEREAKVIHNIPFSRYKRGAGKDKDKGAIYLQHGCGAEIRIFNGPFKSDAWRFAGEARSPRPASVRVVLHEIGHAIHNYPSRRASCIYLAAAKALSARIKKYNATVKRANRTRDPKLNRFLEQEGPRITREKAKVNRMSKRVSRLVKGGPVLAGYKRALGQKSAPTQYGENSLSESFAESYSLYRADPRALGRLLPKVLKWFRDGGHLKFK